MYYLLIFKNMDFIKTTNYCKAHDKMNSTAKHIHFLKATGRRCYL